MAFITVEAEEKKFTDFDDLMGFAKDEADALYRLPFKDFWSNGARFINDKSFGAKTKSFDLNKYSLNSLASAIGINPILLSRISEKGLASAILNDLIGNGNTTKDLSKLELVCDERSNQILGVVGDGYVGYSNHEFIQDILYALDTDKKNYDLIPNLGGHEFKEAYSINSRLFLRLKSKTVTGVVKGSGGDGKDISEIGVQVSNTMAGSHAVKLSWYIYRLICANGLVAQVGGSKGRVIHSGSKKGFKNRLWGATAALFNDLSKAKKLVETLGKLEFDSYKLAKRGAYQHIFSILQSVNSEEMVKQKVKQPDLSHIEDKKERELERMAHMIRGLPLVIGGSEANSVFNSLYRNNASMFDFINSFTAYAKELNYAEKVETESRAGDLANWINNNKRKFS